MNAEREQQKKRGHSVRENKSFVGNQGDNPIGTNLTPNVSKLHQINGASTPRPSLQGASNQPMNQIRI